MVGVTAAFLSGGCYGGVSQWWVLRRRFSVVGVKAAFLSGGC